MKEVIDYRKELERDYLRLRDLRKRKAAALSWYDIHIAAGGDARQALRTAIFLKKNHIKYHLRQLEAATAPVIRNTSSTGEVVEQLRLF